MALDFTGMNNAQVEAYLRDLYAQGAGSIATQSLGDGIYRYTDSQGRDYQPFGDGWARQLTPNFDPAGGGQFGGYYGTFDQGGNLQNVNFQQADRNDGFLWENPEIMAALLAAAGGGLSFLVNGGLGATGAAGAGAFNAAAAGGNAAVDAITAGSAAGTGIGGGAAGGSGLNSALAGSSWGMPAASSVGGGALGTGLTAGGVGAATLGGASGGGGVLSALGGASTVIPAAAGVLSAVSASNAPKTETTTTDVPAWAQPYGQDILQRAQALAGTPAAQYGGGNPFQVTQDMRDAITATRGTMDQFGAATQGARNFLGSVQSGQRDYTPGQIERASNQYIGQTSAGVNAPQSVMGLAQGAQLNNPYLGGTADRASATNATTANHNALLGLNNPYLQSAIDQAQQDTIRNYNLTTAPGLDARERASGSFGNTGIEQMRAESQRQLAGELGRVATNMRMQDYGLQAQLGEGQAGREQQTNLTNAAASNAMSQFNSGMSATDLARNLGGYQAQGQFNAGNMLNAGMFDVQQGQQAQQFNANLGAQDLNRNANLTQNLSQFNSGVSAQDIGNQFGAWQGNNNLAMSSIAPTLNIANNPIQQAQALYGMGQGNAALGGNAGTFDYNEFLRQQQQPYTNLQTYGNAYSQAVRGGTTTSPTPYVNPWAAGLGAAAGAYGLLSAFR